MGASSNKGGNGNNGINDSFHFPTSKQALIIFVRNPELGKCKTRLAATIGDKAALQVYEYLLQHTATICTDVEADKYVFYSETIKKADYWCTSIFKKRLQRGKDLGERMQHAFKELFDMDYKKVMIIGSDMLELNSEIVMDAFEKLDRHDVVIGPAVDGGYFLLGTNKLHPEIFENKVWSTSTVLQRTMDDLKKYDICLLMELNDIDTFEDMEHYTALKKFYEKP